MPDKPDGATEPPDAQGGSEAAPYLASRPTLLVGECPSMRGTGVTRTRITALAGRPWDEWADWLNLIDDPVIQWTVRQARLAARERRSRFESYETVVLLGRRVGQAVLAGGAGLPWFRRMGRYVVVPHSSGVSRWWNDPENEARARAFYEPLGRQ